MSKFANQIIESLDHDHASWSRMKDGSLRVGGDGLQRGNIKLLQLGNSRPYSCVCVLVDDVEVPLHGWFDSWRIEAATMRWLRRADLLSLAIS